MNLTEREQFSVFVNDVTSELCRIAPLDMTNWFVIPADNWKKERIHHEIGVIDREGVERKIFIEIWFREPYKEKQEALLYYEVEREKGQPDITLENFLDWNYRMSKNKISFSTNRSPESIARDIARKLITDHHIGNYKVAIDRCQRKIDRATEATAYLIPIAERLDLSLLYKDYNGIRIPKRIGWTHENRGNTKIEGIQFFSDYIEFKVNFKQLRRCELEELIQFMEGLAAHEEIMDSK